MLLSSHTLLEKRVYICRFRGQISLLLGQSPLMYICYPPWHWVLIWTFVVCRLKSRVSYLWWQFLYLNLRWQNQPFKKRAHLETLVHIYVPLRPSEVHIVTSRTSAVPLFLTAYSNRGISTLWKSRSETFSKPKYITFKFGGLKREARGCIFNART